MGLLFIALPAEYTQTGHMEILTRSSCTDFHLVFFVWSGSAHVAVVSDQKRLREEYQESLSSYILVNLSCSLSVLQQALVWADARGGCHFPPHIFENG